MSKRKVKCKHCGEQSTQDVSLVYEHIKENGSTQNFYFDKEECLKAFIHDKEFKAKESKELDDLYNIIRRYHRLDLIPSTFFSGYLQPLRNGTFKMGKRVKKYKEGVPFSLMKDTYIYCEQSIDWARTNRKFDGALAELKYCLAIIVDKIPIVKKKNSTAEFANKVAQQQADVKKSNDDIKHQERDVKFKKKSNGGVDLSNLLD